MRRMKFSIAGLMGFVVLAAIAFAALKTSSPIWASVCHSLACAVLIVAVLVATQSRGRNRAFWLGASITGWTYLGFGVLLPALVDHEPLPRFLTSILIDKVRDSILSNPETDSISLTTVTVTPATVPSAPASIGVNSTGIGTSGGTASAPTDPNFSMSGTLSGTIIPSGPAVPAAPAIIPKVVRSTTTTSYNASGSVFSSSTTLGPGSTSGGPSEICFGQIGQSLAVLVFAYLGGLLTLFFAARNERNEANPAPTA